MVINFNSTPKIIGVQLSRSFIKLFSEIELKRAILLANNRLSHYQQLASTRHPDFKECHNHKKNV